MIPIVFCASFVPWLKLYAAGRDELQAPEMVVRLSRGGGSG